MPPRGKINLNATNILCGLILAWYVVMILLGMNPLSPQSQFLIQYGALFGPLVFEGQLWRLISSLFIHVGLLHLFFNTYILFQIGRDVEKIFGPIHFLLIFFFSGLIGGICSLWAHPVAIAAGASGAIFGLAGAAIAFTIRLPKGTAKQLVRQWRNSILIFIGLNILISITIPMIDQYAHLGGLIGGFVLGIIFTKPSLEKKLSLIPGLIVAFFIIISVTGNNPWLNDWFQSKSNYEVTLFQARLALTKGELQEAEKYLNKVVQEKPDEAVAYFLLGVLYFDQKKLSQSEEALKKAQNLEPKSLYNQDLEILLIHIALQEGHFNRAQILMAKFESEYPNDPRIPDLKTVLDEVQKSPPILPE